MIQSRAFTPIKIGDLELGNRIIRTAAFEGMCPDGAPTRDLIEHHQRLAKGGVAMTTVAYCSVSPDGRTYGHQMYLKKEILSELKNLTDGVHSNGAAASIQLGHCGYFASKKVIGTTPLGPSRCFNTYGLSFSRPMNKDDIGRVTRDFVGAARLAASCGFDALEIHLGHGYLLSQFLSPYTNKRDDGFGGSIKNRLKFPLAVIRGVKEAVGSKVSVLAKMNLRDGFRGGLEIAEAVEVARCLESEGVDALILSGGFVSKTPLYMMRGNVPLKEMVSVQASPVRKIGLTLFGKFFVQTYAFKELFFLEEARRIRSAVKLPLVLVGGVCTGSGIETAMDEGFEMVALGRALIADPDFVNKLRTGKAQSTDCDHCNKCIAEMDKGGVRCVLP